MSGFEVVLTIITLAIACVFLAFFIEDYAKFSREYDARQERREYDKARHPATVSKQYGNGHLRVVGGNDD